VVETGGLENPSYPYPLIRNQLLNMMIGVVVRVLIGGSAIEHTTKHATVSLYVLA